MSHKCVKCEKTVYFTEERKYKGLYWHNTCFRCDSCGKSITRGKAIHQKKDAFCSLACAEAQTTMRGGHEGNLRGGVTKGKNLYSMGRVCQDCGKKLTNTNKECPVCFASLETGERHHKMVEQKETVVPDRSHLHEGSTRTNAKTTKTTQTKTTTTTTKSTDDSKMVDSPSGTHKRHIKPTGEVQMEGVLFKQGRRWRKWNKRWCTIRGDIFRYYKTQLESTALGTLPLKDIRSVKKMTKKDNGCCFDITSSDGTLFELKALSADLAKQWYAALTKYCKNVKS